MLTDTRNPARPSTPRAAHLLLPPPRLAGCIALAVVRDTRDLVLSEQDRLNFFPASPLVTLTCVLKGQLHVAHDLCDLETLRAVSPMQAVFALPPQSAPLVSWSPGSVVALTIGIFPDAWSLLGGAFEPFKQPACIAHAKSVIADAPTSEAGWQGFCDVVDAKWSEVQESRQGPMWAGGNLLADWVRQLTLRSALSGPGRSIRALERRMRRMSGQSRQTLEFFARLDHLHGLTVRNPDTSAAQIAYDGGYSDQSHMGRSVKRATGFSPVQLNKCIELEEAFWCYRLLGERY